MKNKSLFLILLAMFFFGCSSDSNDTTVNNSSNVADIDGNVYPTVKIGEQVWLQKNLNVSHYRNGDLIPEVQDPTQWANLTTGAWCYYENLTSNGVIYGKLYNWYAVNDPRGLAPEGWHIPSYNEWTSLISFLGGTSLMGVKMKESGTNHWLSPNQATNSSGFTGLPGSARNTSGAFDIPYGKEGYWWSSTEKTNYSAWDLYLTNSADNAYWSSYTFTAGFSVRCVKN